MEQEIREFIEYLHNTKKTSQNTEVSYQRDLNKDYDEKTLKDWQDNGIMEVHYLTEDEMAAFKELSDPVYDSYAQQLVKNGMSKDEVTAFLAAFGVKVDL